ncbi:MAG: hypothetical protein WCK37_00125 [Candidatus Falkowbacteria bacterium]
MNNKRAKEYLDGKIAPIMADTFKDPNDSGKTCLPDKALRDLVEENLLLTQKLAVDMEYVKKYVRQQKIAGIIRWILIFVFVIAPVILSVYYMPVIVSSTQKFISGMFDSSMSSSTAELLKNIKPAELQKYLK